MEVKLNIEPEDFPLVTRIIKEGLHSLMSRDNRELYCSYNNVIAETKYIIDLHEVEKVFNPIFDEYHKIIEEENKNKRRETYNRLKEEFKDEDKEEAYSVLSQNYYDKY